MQPNAAPGMFVEEVPEWFEQFVAARTPLVFAHSPLDLLPFRYVGTIGRANGLLVICSGTTEADGKRWVHVSMSRRSRLPSYDDMALVKDSFIGRDKLALQLFVPNERHINYAHNCLHLWHCMDGDPAPDFRHGGLI
jgi:hypothetical protein